MIWDEHGPRDESGEPARNGLTALREGNAESLRLAEPTPGELESRLAAELGVSLRALESTNDTYQQRRFSPGKLEPAADALWRATAGYLDVLKATR